MCGARRPPLKLHKENHSESKGIHGQQAVADNDRPMRAATGPAVRSSPTRVGSSTRVSTWLQRPSRRRYAAPSARPHSFHELASETWLSESDPFASGFLTRHSVERKLPSTCVPTS
ncbi:hypothetical protein ANCCEY_09708 [Ancylostoma ceylanicum]|uniref:Uncharacterized protein n=1 Tax=Ancylostoma ceylanicum TaxID=53326 RepID=A0A0D6LGK2_9BILA|nr:hypothetical protein ANCCEY_09708 [Ancylostoma ceylanicum]